jgi:dihydroxy-acid dehydratase
MRKGLTSYGDAGFSLFLRKAFIKAMGYSDDALDRPIVGIAGTASDFNPCHGNAPQLIEAVKRGAMLAGAMPMVFPTISIHESFAYPTSMLLRNLMAMDTEEMIRALPLDSVVLVGGCDKTTPAQVMAAVSADRPAIVLPVGPMLVGHFRGEALGTCTDCRRLWAEHRSGRLDAEAIEVANARLVPSVGTCGVMGTASTIACMMEAMGLALPAAATIPATHADRMRLAEATGRRAAELAHAGGPKPSDILTRDALRNGIVAMQAIGGSTNAVVHLLAVAGRLGLDLSLEDWDKWGKDVPTIVDLMPSGRFLMEDFCYAGGIPVVMKALAEHGLLNKDIVAVNGKTVWDNIKDATNYNKEVIRDWDKPLTKSGGIAVLRGNLAPNGAIIKPSAATPALMQHRGRAVVFENIDDYKKKIVDPNLDIDETCVMVLKNCGPKGYPGMAEVGNMGLPPKVLKKGITDMVRISDARMSGTAYGTVVLHTAPEAAAGGPLALVKDGDTIELDVAGRRLHIDVPDAELAKRKAAWKAPEPDFQSGYQRLYVDHVLQADKGADLDFLVGCRGAGVPKESH